MDSIRFPNLHITFNHVGRGIEIFGFTINFYGMVIALGILIALYFTLKEAKRLGYSDESFIDVFFTTVVSGIIGARIYYVIFAWDLYKDNLISIFNLRQGGLAIYGGIIFGTLGMFLMSKRKKIPMLVSGDIMIFGVLIGQILGRWGNFFNREAFGGYTDNLFAMQLPLDAVRSRSDITDEMMDNLANINGIDFVSVHPTFLYESLYNIVVFIILLLFRKKKQWNGQIMCLYFMLYGIGRFFIEALRTDQLKLFGTNLAVSQILSAVLAASMVICLIIQNYRLKSDKNSL